MIFLISLLLTLSSTLILFLSAYPEKTKLTLIVDPKTLTEARVFSLKISLLLTCKFLFKFLAAVNNKLSVFSFK